jgi:hypothetical protein
MCNSTMQQSRPRYQVLSQQMAGTGNHALQDYQMQLMLLEQQNKKRLMMARQEQDPQGYSYYNQNDGNNMVISTLKSPIPYTLEDHGPSWIAPLSQRYFDMIRSFHIVLNIPTGASVTQARYGANALGQPGEYTKEYEMMIYEFCDHLHRLMGRLHLSPKKRLHLRLDIEFGQSYDVLDVARSHINRLLLPFKGLEKSAQVEVGKIVMNASGGSSVVFLYGLDDGSYVDPTWGTHCFANLGEDISGSLARFEQTDEGRKVFGKYWKLEETMIRINQECPRTVIFYQFKGLLHDARVARESGDLTQFEAVFDNVVQIWSEYTKSQKSFQDIIGQEFEGVFSDLITAP